MNFKKILFFSFLLMGCEPTVVNEEDVNWDNYSPIVRERINSHIDSRNCNLLQKEIETASELGEQQIRRTGESNYKIVAYIDDSMRQIGCYD